MNTIKKLKSLTSKMGFFYKKQHKPWIDPKYNQSNRQKSSYLHIGLYGVIFASCFAAIPVYRIFCQHVGLTGNIQQKQYDFKGKKIANLKKYKVIFKGQGEPGIDWTFTSVQKQVFVSAAQTAIVFYKVHNNEQNPIIGFSTYNITPQQANIYFSKIQCFCFNQQLINPKQELLLPLFFYLQPEINDDPNVSRISQITVDYRFYRSDKQQLAKFAEEQLRKLQLNKKILNKMRAKKAGITLEEYQSKLEASGELAPEIQ